MPEKFLSHKVKKKETVFGITRKYNITESQLYEYNPLLKKIGLRRRMVLRIPVYPKVVEKVPEPLVEIDQNTQAYIVKPKVPNELKKSIQQKVADAKSSGQVKNLMHDKTIYHFPRIIIKRDDLYYNLANDRTLTKTREFIKRNIRS